jgi:glutathione peroxidase
MTALQEISFETMSQGASTLGAFDGSVVLVVNVASKCGLTPQYEGLERLATRYRDQGLVVVGFPANDFMGQEPGSDEEILEFCTSTYAVDFPIMSKISVTGKAKHPLYAALIAAQTHAAGDPEAHRDRLRSHKIDANEDPEVLWNFEKFLISRDGEVVGRFAPNLDPEDAILVSALESELAAG